MFARQQIKITASRRGNRVLSHLDGDGNGSAGSCAHELALRRSGNGAECEHLRGVSEWFPSKEFQKLLRKVGDKELWREKMLAGVKSEWDSGASKLLQVFQPMQHRWSVRLHQSIIVLYCIVLFYREAGSGKPESYYGSSLISPAISGVSFLHFLPYKRDADRAACQTRGSVTR